MYFVGSKIKMFDDYINKFRAASDIAKKEGRLKNAATYLRASEFLISPNDDRKIPVYKKWQDYYDSQSVDCVAQLYEKDIDLFEYDFQ